MTRAFLVDDEDLALRRLSRLLTETGRIEVVGTSNDPSMPSPGSPQTMSMSCSSILKCRA